MSNQTKFTSGFLKMHNDKGLEGVFSTLGAGCYSLTLHGKPLILQPKDVETYLSSPQFFGKTLGRVAGRIPETIHIIDEDYKVLADKKGICLHGGELESLSFRNFKSEVFPNKDEDSIVFVYVSPDGECGFPGNLEVRITYAMPRTENALIITQEFRTTKETWVSLSNHIYWNFFGDENVNDYTLMVNAGHYGVFKKGTQLVVDEAAVPECLDFQTPALLKEKLDRIEKEIPEIGTLDHAFRFHTAAHDEPQVVLESKDLRLECRTDYNGLNLYVDTSMTDVEFANRPGLKKRRAIAIEPQLFPTDSKLVVPGITYKHVIRYDIKTK